MPAAKIKKEPFAIYDRKNKVFPILGIMACESIQRQTTYIKQGSCNVFGEMVRKQNRYLYQFGLKMTFGHT